MVRLTEIDKDQLNKYEQLRHDPKKDNCSDDLHFWILSSLVLQIIFDDTEWNLCNI